MIDLASILTLDVWTFYHLVGGLALGIVFYFLVNRKFKAIILALPSLWEVFEQNVLASWFHIVEQEVLVNSAMDILLTTAMIFIGFVLINKVLKRNKRR